MYDINSLKQIFAAKLSTRTLFCIVEQDTLYAFCEDCSVHTFDLVTGIEIPCSEIKHILSQKEHIRGEKQLLVKDDCLLFSKTLFGIKSFDFSDFSVKRYETESSDFMSSFVVSENFLFVSYSGNGKICVIDMETNQKISELQTDGEKCTNMLCHGNLLFALLENGKLEIWDIDNYNKVKTINNVERYSEMAANGDLLYYHEWRNGKIVSMDYKTNKVITQTIIDGRVEKIIEVNGLIGIVTGSGTLRWFKQNRMDDKNEF